MNMMARINFTLISKAAMVFSSNSPGPTLLQAWCTVVDYAGNIRHNHAVDATFLHLRSVANSDKQNMGTCTHFAMCARELASGTKVALSTNNVPQKANFAARVGMRCRLYARALSLAPCEEGDLPCRFRGICCRAVCTRFSVPSTIESLWFPADAQHLRVFRLFQVFLKLVFRLVCTPAVRSFLLAWTLCSDMCRNTTTVPCEKIYYTTSRFG